MGQIITDDALEPYIDDVLNELEVKLSRLPQSAPANGCSTFSLIQTHGELRASHGFPELSPVTHVQIGNEDHLWGGGPSYGERFTRFHDATKTPAHHHHQRPRVPSKPKPAGSGWTTTRTTRQMRWLANSTCSTMSTGHCRIDNANDLVSSLTTKLNRARQAQITTEICLIMDRRKYESRTMH